MIIILMRILLEKDQMLIIYIEKDNKTNKQYTLKKMVYQKFNNEPPKLDTHINIDASKIPKIDLEQKKNRNRFQ